jgi:formamidopyrimidine-DNA glycosylase
MPEGDTVYRAARTLDRALAGKRLARAELRLPALAGVDLRGVRVLGTGTHGKHLFTRFDSGRTLHTHLRMDGQWRVLAPGRRAPGWGADSVRVVLGADDGAVAVGERIPVVELMPTAAVGAVTARLGPDPLHDGFDLAEAVRRLAAAPDRPIAAALLDQHCLAGLGNFWVTEVCFLRGYHPDRPVRDCDVPATVRLAARALVASATRRGMYQVTTGDIRPGRRTWVYGRESRPCSRCGTTIVVRGRAQPVDRAGRDITVSGTAAADERRCWWCPHCQPR